MQYLLAELVYIWLRWMISPIVIAASDRALQLVSQQGTAETHNLKQPYET